MSTTSSGGRSSAPATTNTIAVWKPWLRPVRTMKTCATAADDARSRKVSQSERRAVPSRVSAAPPAASAAAATHA